MCMHHAHVWYLQRPEEGMRAPGNRECQKKKNQKTENKEELLSRGLVPEDTVGTGTRQGLLEKTIPGSRMGSGYSEDYQAQLGPPSSIQLGVQGIQLVFTRTTSVCSYFFCQEVSGTIRNCFPFTSLSQCPWDNIMAIQFASWGNSSPKTLNLIR